MKSGRFLTLEGIDGAGKTTHLAWVKQRLEARGLQPVITREPGGTHLGEALRAVLLNGTEPIHPETEALLMFAARREHLDKVIRPALERGAWVVSDRFTDASYAYQAGGSHVAWDKIATLEGWVQEGLQPDLTIYFDVLPEVGRKRTGAIKTPDRFEGEQEAFHARVREAYLRRAREWPARIRVIDSSGSISQVQQELELALSGLFSS